MNRGALIRLLPLLALLALPGCLNLGMTPNPPGGAPAPAEPGGKKPSDKKSAGVKSEEASMSSAWLDDANLPDRRVRTRDVDFARAFDDGGAPRDTVKRVPSAPVVRSLRYPPYRLAQRRARVAIARGVKEASVNSSASASVRTFQARLTFRGRASFEADLLEPGLLIATVGGVRKGLRMPCTLSVGTGHLEYGGGAYRGAIVFVSEGGKDFSVINLIDVEDYLRGVVPLEIGNLREAEIEAVKAQAVAARTYTYLKMAQNAKNPFDLLSTTSDQVYGGASAEAAVSDMALLMTKDLIMVYEDAIVHAYYHSTCGGTTANIEDVWGGQPYPYLKSLSDVDVRGRAWCAGTTSYSWTETWSVSQLTGFLSRYSSSWGVNPPFSGSLRRIEVRERFVCGRVKRLAIISSTREYIAGGDKVRFALRRGTTTKTPQILRSSNIRSVKISGGEVTITGSGHGHGIGMCQVGAIARARSGQDFEQILRAYYSGVSVRTVLPE